MYPALHMQVEDSCETIHTAFLTHLLPPAVVHPSKWPLFTGTLPFVTPPNTATQRMRHPIHCHPLSMVSLLYHFEELPLAVLRSPASRGFIGLWVMRKTKLQERGMSCKSGQRNVPSGRTLWFVCFAHLGLVFCCTLCCVCVWEQEVYACWQVPHTAYLLDRPFESNVQCLEFSKAFMNVHVQQ